MTHPLFRVACAAVAITTLGACPGPAPISLSTATVASGIGAQFDAQIAPALRDVCTATETALLRGVTIDMAVAMNQIDMTTLDSVTARVQAISPQCLSRYNNLSCQRQISGAAQTARGGIVPDLPC